MATPAVTGLSPEQDALRERGNGALQAGDHARAIALYSEALDLAVAATATTAATTATSDGRALLLSNRCAARLGMNDYVDALVDAEECVRLRPGWPKAWARKGAALFGLGRLGEAAAAYRTAAERSVSAGERTQYSNLAVQCEANARPSYAPDDRPSPAAVPTEPTLPWARGLAALALGLRVVSLAFVLGYVFTADDAMFTRSMSSMAAGLIAEVVAYANVRPTLAQHYLEVLLRNPNAIPALMALAYISIPPNLAAALAVHVLHTGETARRGVSLLAQVAPQVASGLTLRVAESTWTDRVLRIPGWSTMGPAAKWSAYSAQVKRLTAKLEIGAFATQLALVFVMPTRALVGALVLAQTLRLRNLTEPASSVAWIELDAALRPLAYRAPQPVGRLYDRAASAVRTFAAPPTRANTQMGGTSLPRMCAVM